MERKEFVLTPTGRLFKGSFVDDELLEFINNSWSKPTKEVYGWEFDPREDDIEFFSDETSALKALKSCSSNNYLK